MSDTGAVERAARAWTRITGLPLGAEGSPTPDTIRAALAAPTVEQVAAREAVQRLIDQAVEVAADDTPLLTAVQDARAAVAALWGAR